MSVSIRPLLALALGAAAALLPALPASAHLEPDPGQAPPGTKVTIAFVVQHGCVGSATTKLEMKLPAGISAVRIVPKAGWKGSIAKGIATWSGGPLPSAQPSRFPLEFVTPNVPGDLQFKVVQTCEVGELDWIEQPGPNGEEPELPHPDPQGGRHAGIDHCPRFRGQLDQRCACHWIDYAAVHDHADHGARLQVGQGEPPS